MSDANDREWRENLMRVYAEQPHEERMRLLSRLLMIAIELGCEIPEETREGLRLLRVPGADVHAN